MTLTQAEKESIAIEIVTKHGRHYTDGIKEIRNRLDCGLTEAKDLSDIARHRTGTTERDYLAQDVLRVHGPEYAAGELAARTNLSREQAQQIIADLMQAQAQSTVPTPTIQPNWNVKSAERWLRSYAAHLSRTARYIRENAAGFAENEDEFRCGLANGLGIDDVAEQDEIIAEVHKTVDRSADRPSRKYTKSTQTA